MFKLIEKLFWLFSFPDVVFFPKAKYTKSPKFNYTTVQFVLIPIHHLQTILKNKADVFF